jgi:hypothetical protein
MKLHPVHAMGIHAYCSDLIVDPTDPETVYFMSVAGYQAAVKGILANLLGNYGISIEVDGESHYLTRARLGYKAVVKKLPSGLLHAALFPKLALARSDEGGDNSFFIVTDDKDGLLALFFRHLDEKTDLPLHPSWARRLWEAFEEQEGWLIEAQTVVGSYQGYLIEFNQEDLHDLISEAIRRRDPNMIGCMERKGGKASGKLDLP